MAVYDDKSAADRKRAKLQREEARLRKYRLENAVTSLFKTREGREFLWFLLELGRVSSVPFREDPYKTAFACGEQNVGVQIQILLTETDPVAYAEMMKERVLDARTNAAKLAAASGLDESDAADEPDSAEQSAPGPESYT